MDLLALKRIINWSSVGSVHDGIVPFPVSGLSSVNALWRRLVMAKVTVFTHLVLRMTDNLMICRVGRNCDFWDHFDIQMFAPCEPCQVPHYRPRRWRQLTVPAQKAAVSLACSFEIMFRRKVFKPQLLVTRGSTLQVLRWKHCLAIWSQIEIREFFSDQNPFVEICHIESRPLANLGTTWWPRVQRVDWAGVVMATSLPCPTWQLCKSRLSNRM